MDGIIDENWRGFQFTGCNYYIDKISATEAELDSVILEYSGGDIIVISHPIYFCPDKYDASDEYPFSKKLYYYINVPSSGLTIYNLFTQINTQSQEYTNDFINDLNIYSATSYFIDDICEITKTEYRLLCRVWMIDTD
tara:strand:- start:1784 stop:2197 length:414 start_codon:yes stop_codon:yes gene_type:complete